MISNTCAVAGSYAVPHPNRNSPAAQLRSAHALQRYCKPARVPSDVENSSGPHATQRPGEARPHPCSTCPTPQRADTASLSLTAPQRRHAVRWARVVAKVLAGHGTHAPLLLPPHPASSCPGGHSCASHGSQAERPVPLQEGAGEHDAEGRAYLPSAHAKHWPWGAGEPGYTRAASAQP